MRTFVNLSLTSIMAWCERALEKCERPKDESHHAQRKGHQALKCENLKSGSEKKSHQVQRKSDQALKSKKLKSESENKQEPPCQEKKQPCPKK